MRIEGAGRQGNYNESGKTGLEVVIKYFTILFCRSALALIPTTHPQCPLSRTQSHFEPLPASGPIQSLPRTHTANNRAVWWASHSSLSIPSALGFPSSLTFTLLRPSVCHSRPPLPSAVLAPRKEAANCPFLGY